LQRSARAVLGLVAALLFGGIVRADDAWQPLVTQDGVSVEQRSAPGRALPELRATVEIDAGIFEVLAVISDVPRQTQWMHDCEESRLVREDSSGVSLVYNRTAAPWPVSDRDVVLRTETTLLAPSQHVALRFANVTTSGTPPIDGVVRMPRLVGEYDLDSVSPTRTRVTYLLDIDPGGSLPTFAVTRTTRKTPLHTLLGLRRQVAATRGTYADFVTAWSERR
jgi:hypothetical protein